MVLMSTQGSRDKLRARFCCQFSLMVFRPSRPPTPGQNKTRQHRARQDNTGQDNTRQGRAGIQKVVVMGWGVVRVCVCG